MNQIEKKVRAAGRRLLIGRFAELLCWTLAASWLIAVLAIAARAVWVLPWDSSLWVQSWLIGSTIAGFLVAAVWSWSTQPSLVSIATEVDQRFALKQRLGSVLAMREDDRQSPMGQALLQDTSQRAEQLAINERFALAPTKLALLPLLPAALIAIALLFIPAVPGNASARPSAEMLAQAEQVKKSTEALKKKLSDQRKKAEAAGLKDAAEMFTKLEADVNKMSQKETVEPKEALIALNDLKKQLDERRKQLGSPESMRQTLAKMSDQEKGPAESIVKAMKEGSFGDAKEKAKELTDKLRNDKLTPLEKALLQSQMNELKDKLKELAEKHATEKEQLQRLIEEAKREGLGEEATKLQQKLNELQAQDAQVEKMQQMAEAMNAAAEAMAQGDSEKAAEAIEGMADQLGEMQDAMEQLQDIEETLDTLSQSKDQMRCKQCSGQGCDQCQGNGPDNANSDKSGKGGSRFGLGKGSGLSGPEEDEGETQKYESQVRGDPKQGRGLNAGFADGANRKGVTKEEVKAVVLGAISDESDPLENQTLPRMEREHAREYFDKLRGK
jgi:hypothetical protein